MDLYPAIDLRAGRCVRLRQGDYGQETVYGEDPAAQARAFVAAGARRLHVVDLDAARSGEAANLDAVAAVTSAVDVPVQVGGGIRSVEAARRRFDIGVSRVVMGTAAVESPDLVAAVAELGPVAVGLDVRGREVAVRGWEKGSGRDLLDLIPVFDGSGAAAYVVTQIVVDGTMEGPDTDGLAAVQRATSTPVIASGGVGRPEHLDALVRLDGPRPLAGVIVGRALYEGTLTVAGALARLAGRIEDEGIR
jgi:phosphoribosylformimino-5-aminoimidazole carboxamide ribotide isomerase